MTKYKTSGVLLTCWGSPHDDQGYGYMSWIKLVCHKLTCITFPTKKLPDFYNNQSLQRAFDYSFATQWSRSANFYVSLLTLLHTECCISVFYLFLWHHCRATRKVFEEDFLQFAMVCLWSYWEPLLWVSMHACMHHCKNYLVETTSEWLLQFQGSLNW